MEELAELVKKRHKTHLIFDFDATLFLLLLPWEKWGEGMRRELVGKNAKIWDAWRARSINVSEMQNQYVEKYGEEILQTILKHNENFETSRLKGWEPHDDLLRIVRSFGAGYKKYIWSSNTRKIIGTVLSREGLADEFERLVTRNDVRLIKPDPEGFKLIHDPKIPKSRYILIGDSRSDKGAAKRAGIDYFSTDYFRQRL